MKARYVIFAPIALAVSLWATTAFSVTVTCEVCTTTCISVNNVPHCSKACFGVPCGAASGGGLRYQMSSKISAKDGTACTVRVKTPNGMPVPGKVSGHYCVLEKPVH
jgi:hypothetical protein